MFRTIENEIALLFSVDLILDQKKGLEIQFI